MFVRLIEVTMHEFAICCSSAPEISSLPMDSKSHGKSSKASTPSTGKKQMSLLPKSSSGPCSATDSSKYGNKSSSASSLSSPKPKRNLFGGLKQTLRGKSCDGSKCSGKDKDSEDQKNSPVSTPVSGSQSLADSLSALSVGRTSLDDSLQVSICYAECCVCW